MKLMPMLTLIGALAMGSPAFAHEAEKGPHGGRVIDAGEYHVELVPKAGTIEVFITDAKDQPGPAGFKGVAILIIDGKQQRIVLESTAPGRLSGKATALASASVKGVVRLTTPQGTPVTARFQ